MAEERKEKKEKEETAEKAPTSSKKLLYISIAGVVIFLAILSGVVLALSGGGENESAANGSSESSAEENDDAFYIDDPDNVLTGAIVPLEAFVVNLEAEDTFLQVELKLQFFDFSPPEDLEKKVPKIRDAVIKVLSSSEEEKILTLSGKEELRVKLLYEINKLFDEKEAQVVDIYFLDFLVQ